MRTKQALGRGLSWAGRVPASHPDKALFVVPVAPHTRPCPTNWAQGLHPAATQACSTPPCASLSTLFTVGGPHQDIRSRLGGLA